MSDKKKWEPADEWWDRGPGPKPRSVAELRRYEKADRAEMAEARRGQGMTLTELAEAPKDRSKRLEH